MSEDKSSTAAESTAQGQEQAAPDASELIKNTRAELSRKTANLEQKLAETNAQLAQMIEMVTKANSQPSAPSKPAKELLFEDPEAFISQVEAKAVSKAEERVSRAREADAAMQSAVGEMSAKFPEFATPGSEAAQLAIDLANKLPPRLKGTAEGVRLVMAEAAAELGLVPASKRQKQQAQSSNEDFVAGSKSSGSETRKAASSSPSKKVDEKTLAFAQLLGIDVTDKKRLESLAKASERTNWKSYK